MTAPTLAIIDYGMGNLRSVQNAFRTLGVEATITARPDDLKRADAIVLPGVGAFGDAMQNLRQGGFLPVMEAEVRKGGKPFIGLCLGMQLLATTGLEHGTHAGLDWIPGACRRVEPTPQEPDLRVPHMGWNDVRFLKKDGLYAGLGESQTFYFVHSYVLEPQDPGVVSGVVRYGTDLVASIETGNIYGAQYHPEKSQKSGLGVLRNFVRQARLVHA